MTETPSRIVSTLQLNQKRGGWAKDEKNLKDLGETDMTDDNSFLRQTWRITWKAPRELEESGKILGKDLWVRAHSKETPLKKISWKDRLHQLI